MWTNLFMFLALLNPDQPRLMTRVFPVIQTADLGRGCSTVLMTAEIKGIETEEWYCPAIEWEKPDGTIAFNESDCVPFEQRYECNPKRGQECTLDWHVDTSTGAKIIDNNPCECTIPGFPRIWRMRLCYPEGPENGWVVRVRLRKNDDVLAFSDIRFYIK